MDTKKLLTDLISFKSYAKKEQEALKYVQKVLNDNGVNSFFQEENLVAHLKGKDPTKAFILTGHADVVDAGDEKKWKYNPFNAQIEGEKIFGRGSSDMKSGLVAMMQTVISVKDNPPCDLFLVFVVGEETDGSGSVSFVNWLKQNGLNKYKSVAAIIGEPTELKNFQNGHRGNFFIKATLHGDAGHAARPEKILVNVNKEITTFIHKTDSLNKTWKSKFQNADFPIPTITATSIESKSSSPNKTADTAVVKFDLRTVPNFHDKAFKEVEKLAKKRKIDLEIEHPPFVPGLTDKNEKIVKIASKILPKAKIKINDASNDLGVFTQAGIPTIVFGPGESKTSHTTNEYAFIDKIDKAAEIYEKIYQLWAK